MYQYCVYTKVELNGLFSVTFSILAFVLKLDFVVAIGYKDSWCVSLALRAGVSDLRLR